MEQEIYKSPESDLLQKSLGVLTHQSNILRRDLALGTFITQISMTINKVIYLFFTVFFAYSEWSSLFKSWGVTQAFFFAYLLIFYLVLILLFVFLFGVAMSIFTPMLKRGVLGKHNFEFRENGLFESTEYNETLHKYRSIGKVFTRFGTIYIQISGFQWHILPKRDFASVEARRKVLEFIKSQANA